MFKHSAVKRIAIGEREIQSMEAAAEPYQIWVVEKPLAHMCAHIDILPLQTQLWKPIHLTWKLPFHLLGGNHAKRVKSQLINNKGNGWSAASTFGEMFTLWTQTMSFPANAMSPKWDIKIGLKLVKYLYSLKKKKKIPQVPT